MKNKVLLISIAAIFLLLIATIFNGIATYQLRSELTTTQAQLKDLQVLEATSFNTFQRQLDSMSQVIETQEEQIAELQTIISVQQEEISSIETPSLATMSTYSAATFNEVGVIYWNGWTWTWYSEKLLPGEGLVIPGRHTDNEGWVRDGEGYLCLASDTLTKGTIVDTPFGSQGKIYDCGCGIGVLDVYVNW